MIVAYQKTIWKDRIKNPITGEIIEEGTLFTQERANKIEDGIAEAHRLVTDVQGAAIGIKVQGGKLQYKNGENWDDIGMEYKDVTNLSATTAGVISWSLPQSTDNTRTAIVLCRATKDISNMDYATCLADASITKNTLAQNATSNTYTGLTNATQYWVKVFVKYAIGGKEFCSGGVTVTFTTPAQTVFDYYNAGNEHTDITGGWVAEGLIRGVGTAEKLTDALKLTASCPDVMNTLSTRAFSTVNKIDLTNIRYLKIQLSATGNAGSSPQYTFFIVGVGNDKSSYGFSSVSKQTVPFPTTFCTLDVTNINCPVYLLLHAEAFGEVGPSIDARITRVWGES